MRDTEDLTPCPCPAPLRCSCSSSCRSQEMTRVESTTAAKRLIQNDRLRGHSHSGKSLSRDSNCSPPSSPSSVLQSSLHCVHHNDRRKASLPPPLPLSSPIIAFISVMSLLVLITNSPLVTAFNLDVNGTAMLHRGPAGSYFGFDVALHRDRTVHWALVGAPLAQTDQPNVVRGGAVYRCATEAGSAGACQTVPFDTTGHSMTRGRGAGSRPEQTDSKSNQWMGAVVRSSSSGSNFGSAAGSQNPDLIVACAPRYVYFSANLRRLEPVGTCWVSRGSFTGFLEYSPCRTTAWGYHRQGSCQAGFSASITKSGRFMYVGAPGSWYWQGQVFSVDLALPSSNGSTTATAEAPASDDDSFLGYSSTVGHFGGGSSASSRDRGAAQRARDDQDVAVGMPRGANLTGKVVIYDSRMRNIFNLTGEQMGAYFGYSLAAGDLNGDHMDDLIVGAPLYSDLAAAKRGAYERGRVYIAYQVSRDTERAHRSGRTFEIGSVLDGPDESRARFGLSLAVVGDLNKDSYDDLAVGAPYGGPDHRGVVFIYNGAARPEDIKLSQTLYAEDFGDSGLKTFGWSLAGGGIDVDHNLYPDLLIGAYASDRVIQLRARPVVNMSTSLSVSPELIQLDRVKLCSLRDGTRVQCVSSVTCFSYTGLGLDSKLDIYFDLKLDSAARRSPRLFFLDSSSPSEPESERRFTLTLIKEVQQCKEQKIYLINNVRDKLTPLKVELEYGLLDMLPDAKTLKPILNKSAPNRIMRQINIQKNCGTDNVCKPDLKVRLKSNMKEYLIGSSQRIELNLAIENSGEDAFESVLNLFMPLDVNFVKINKQKGDLVTCTGAEPDRSGINVLSCDIGNPLRGNHSVEFDVLVEPVKVPSGSAAPDYTFLAQVNSSNAEAENLRVDNQVEEGIPVRVEVNLTTSGMASLDSILLNVSDSIPDTPNTDDEIGPEVVHTYHVINRGPSAIRSARATLLWPTKNLQDQYLLYIMDQPSARAVRAQVSCRPLYPYEVNPYRVRVAQRRASPSPSPSPSSVLNSGSGHVVTYQPASIGPKPRPPSAAAATWTVSPSWLQENETLLYRDKRHVRGVSTTPTPPTASATSESSIETLLSCGRSQCTRIECEITDLERDSSVTIAVKSRVWRTTVRDTMLEEVFISSKLVTQVTRLPYDVNPAYIPPQVAVVFTRVHVSGLDRPQLVPLWIIILAVVGGLLALSLLALLLYKLGFFNRTKVPHDEFEREPLRLNKSHR